MHQQRLIGMYLVEPVEHDLRLKLMPGQVQPARLGHPQWSSLGYDTWILSESYTGEAEVTFPGLIGGVFPERRTHPKDTLQRPCRRKRSRARLRFPQKLHHFLDQFSDLGLGYLSVRAH